MAQALKFYRLKRSHENGESAGFEYFTNLREAERAFRDWMKGEEEWVCAAEGTEIEEIKIEQTKAGILRALRRFASHADNG